MPSDHSWEMGSKEPYSWPIVMDLGFRTVIWTLFSSMRPWREGGEGGREGGREREGKGGREGREGREGGREGGRETGKRGGRGGKGGRDPEEREKGGRVKRKGGRDGRKEDDVTYTCEHS